MKSGLFAINYGTCADPEVAVRVARHAEQAGLESVWTGEHIVLPDPRPAGFSMPPTLPFIDTIVALTLIAAETTSIKVASGIIELPLHHPVLLAKQLASIDQLSRGRLIVGVAAGYLAHEFAALGVDRSERGQLVEEHLAAMRALWSMDHPRFSGSRVSFDSVNAYPRPVNPGGPPIVMGGESRPALRRAVTLAHGWYGFYLTLDETAAAIRDLEAERSRNDRPEELGPLEITVTPAGRFDRSTAERFEELGVDRLVFLPRIDAASTARHDPVPVDDILSTIDSIAEFTG